MKISHFFTVIFKGDGEACYRFENSKVASLLSVMLSGYTVSTLLTFRNGVTGIVNMLQSTSCILQLELASKPQNLRASDCMPGLINRSLLNH